MMPAAPIAWSCRSSSRSRITSVLIASARKTCARYHPIFQRYLVVDNYLDPEMDARVRRETIQINEALGYDINTVEFAIANGTPYAIDYMNPAPDADWWSVGSVYFKW